MSNMQYHIHYIHQHGFKAISLRGINPAQRETVPKPSSDRSLWSHGCSWTLLLIQPWYIYGPWDERGYKYLYITYWGSKNIDFIVQLLSCFWIFMTMNGSSLGFPSFTIFQSLLKLMSIKSVMPSNHVSLCCPLLLLPSIFPASESFPVSWLFTSGGQSIGASASTLPTNIQDQVPLIKCHTRWRECFATSLFTSNWQPKKCYT